MELREYQKRSINQLYDWFRHNQGNPCLNLPTGSGKSIIIASLCQDALSNWPETKIILLTHVKELIEQDTRQILNVWADAPVGIYSASVGVKKLGYPITVAGIQSIRHKAKKVGHIDLCIVDEAHLINHKAEGSYRKFIDDLKEINPSLRVIGLTATPYRLGHGLITDKPAIFDDILEPTSIEELLAHGYLAPLRSKRPDNLLSTDGVNKRGGEFVEAELQRAVNKKDQNLRVACEIVRYAEERKAWLIFCTGVKHAHAMAKILKNLDIPTACITGETPKNEREEIINNFKSGGVRAITNANVLCLDEETEILTSSGFVGINEMNSDYLIAGWKLDGQIEFAPPEQIVRRDRMENESMVVFGGGMAAEIRVTANHRMVIQCGSKRSSYKVVSAESLVGKSFSIPAFGHSIPIKITAPIPDQPKSSFSKQVIANSYNYRKKGYSEEVAKRKAEELARRKLSMKYKNPEELSLWECQFIGFWLGDGTLSKGRMSITQSMVYLDIVEKAENIFKECDLHYTKYITTQRDNMNDNAVRWCFSRGTGGDRQEVDGGYFSLEPYLKKKGTQLFLGLKKEQLEALLYGLWLADGIHHGKSNRKNKFVAGSSFELYNILQAACSMRGISAVLSKASLPRKENHTQQWILAWGGRKFFCYTKNSSHLETERKQERVWCVTSTTSFLICRRKGKVFVIGNTTGFDYPDIDLIAMCRPTLSPGLYVQMAGRGMRTKSHTDHCLVLDFAGVVQTHGPITAVQPPIKKGSGTGEAPVKVCEECHELVHLAARICPACGHKFPPPQVKPLKLHNDDIMGKEKRMPVRAWEWARRTSFTSGKTMATVTYYGESYTDAVTEYFCLLHGGYAGQKAIQKLFRIAKLGFQKIPEDMARESEADLHLAIRYIEEGAADVLDDVVEIMNELPPPSSIAYQKDGKFFNTYDWEWVQMIEKSV